MRCHKAGAECAWIVRAAIELTPCGQRRYQGSAPVVATSQNWETSPTYQTQSLAFLDKLASRYASSPALIAIGLLNKPTVPTHRVLPYATGGLRESARPARDAPP